MLWERRKQEILYMSQHLCTLLTHTHTTQVECFSFTSCVATWSLCARSNWVGCKLSWRYCTSSSEMGIVIIDLQQEHQGAHPTRPLSENNIWKWRMPTILYRRHGHCGSLNPNKCFRMRKIKYEVTSAASCRCRLSPLWAALNSLHSYRSHP